MEIGTMRNFAVKKFVLILTYLILLYIVTAVSAKKFMSNVPDAATQLQEFDNNASAILQGFEKCLICGCSHAGPQENIISGDPVDPPNKYPWMVQVIYVNTSDCGGSILDRYHILSAAHCFFKRENCSGPYACKKTPDEIAIKLLTSNSNELRKGPPVEEIFMHPKYELGPYSEHDIAVLKLKNPITCNAFASPICLPPPNFRIPAKRLLSIAGWGITVKPSEVSGLDPNPPLLEAKAMPVDVSRCGFIQRNGTGLLCTTGIGGQIACNGDSGGPMFFQKKVFYILGLHSRQIGDCDGKMVQTDVSKYMKYIQNITGLQSAHEVEVQRKNGGKRNNKRRTNKNKQQNRGNGFHKDCVMCGNT